MAVSRSRKTGGDSQKLQSEWEKGIFRKVYLFYGEERYLVLQYRDRLIRKVVPPDDPMNLNIHKGASTDISKVMDECMDMPFMAERRLVVLQDTGYFSSGTARKSTAAAVSGNPNAGRTTHADLGITAAPSGAGKGDAALPVSGYVSGKTGKRKKDSPSVTVQDRLISLLSSLPDTTILLFVESDADRRGRLFKAVSQTGLAVEFLHPDEETLRRWILTGLNRHSVRITNEALDIFLERAGQDLASVQTETDKLLAYAGEGGTLRAEDIRALVHERLETRIFDLVDAAGRRDRKETIRRYDELIRMQEEPGRILYFLGRQFNLLYQTKALQKRRQGNAEMMKAMDLKYSFQLRKLTEQAKYFDEGLLRSAVEDCVQMEQRFKSGQADPCMAVELLLVKYSR